MIVIHDVSGCDAVILVTSVEWLILILYQLLFAIIGVFFFFFSSRRRHTRYWRDWSSDVCSSDLDAMVALIDEPARHVEAHPAHAVDPYVHYLPPFGRCSTPLRGSSARLLRRLVSTSPQASPSATSQHFSLLGFDPYPVTLRATAFRQKPSRAPLSDKARSA